MNILFLCVANSARSQMAEALARDLVGTSAKIFSAGSNPSFVHPLAKEVLQENGIEIPNQRSKSVAELEGTKIDLVITLCAEEVCPNFLGAAERWHWPMPDPAGDSPSRDEQKEAFRKVRDKISNELSEKLIPYLDKRKTL